MPMDRSRRSADSSRSLSLSSLSEEDEAWVKEALCQQEVFAVQLASRPPGLAPQAPCGTSDGERDIAGKPQNGDHAQALFLFQAAQHHEKQALTCLGGWERVCLARLCIIAQLDAKRTNIRMPA